MSITQESQSATRHESNDHPWSSSKMEVYLRIRPMNKLEKSKRSKNCVRYHTLESDKGHDIVPRLTVDSPSDGEFDFSFDKVSNETISHVSTTAHSDRLGSAGTISTWMF